MIRKRVDIILSIPLSLIYVNLVYYLLLNISSRWVFHLPSLFLNLDLEMKHSVLHHLCPLQRVSICNK